jgi:hypothetical protein
VRILSVILILASLQSLAADISQLSWLSGCWSYDAQDSGSGEYWTPPAGGSMLAVARTVRDGQTVGFEYLRIAETDEESLALFASPSGQTPARFELLSLTETEVVFENSDHDFPQRVIYRIGENGTVLGRVEGESDGTKIGIDFPMTRTSCDELAL